MKTEFVYGEFKDFKGETHKVVVCGITYVDIDVKYLFIGAAIQNPKDEYNKALGEKIAYSKAEKEETWLSSSHLGLFNSNTVPYILKDYLGYICNNPSKFIKGYAEAEQKYHQEILDKQYLSTLSDEDKSLIKKISSLSESFISNAKKLAKYL